MATVKVNALGRVVAGNLNPNWKGGLIAKSCVRCGELFSVKYGRRNSAKMCSLDCWNAHQKATPGANGVVPWAIVTKLCEYCAHEFSVQRSHAKRMRCCSRPCSYKLRRAHMSGEGNPNWAGGVSRLPYAWDFRYISRRIIEAAGGVCQNPRCAGIDQRMTTHHIDYDKSNNEYGNLIALCSSCNSKANFGRDRWREFYVKIKVAAAMFPMRFIAVTSRSKKNGGGWAVEEF